MSSGSRAQKQAKVVALDERAYDTLQYIRDTLESAGAFTAVPGWGGVAMGVLGIVGAIVAGAQDSFLGWLWASVLTACAATLTGGVAMLLKTRATGSSLATGPGRKFVLGLSPALIAALPITWVMVPREQPELLAATWHLLYGAAVISAGAFSVRPVPLMGVCFMIVGGLCFLAPAGSAPVLMGVGFGGLHLIFGATIAIRHGG